MDSAPERAHTVIVKAGADTALDLAWHLRHLADDIEHGKLTAGCSGSPSSGSVYSYKVRPEQTHDVYFQQIAESLGRAALEASNG